MLFLPQSVYDARASLWSDFESGKTTAEQAFPKMLELDADDFLGLMGVGKLREDAGDLAAAEQCFWRAIQAHPGLSGPYMELARILHRQPETAALSNALAQLGIAKRALDDETFLEELDFNKGGFTGKALKEFKKLDKAAQGRLIAMAMREQPDDEPDAVTERLRPHRLLQQMQEDGDLDAETVDAIVREGASMVPLLVGVLRDWAQDLLGNDDDSAVENALALLGEIGSPTEIPHLLEFVDLQNDNARGAASWALGRIVERHTDESARFIASIAAGLGPAERLAVAEQILRHPALDPVAKLLEQLSEDIELMSKEDRNAFFPALLGAMVAVRGREGVTRGFTVLRQQGGLLSRNVRRECESLLADFRLEGVSPAPIEPSPLTVYQICAGEAVWEDDEDGDEDEEDVEDKELEEDFLPVPEPVHRKVTPGRNDPCWCNSGKKYKKCHLDSDQSAAVPGSNEFSGLRRRIGEFLGQVLPQRELKLAIEEYSGDRPPETEDTNIAVTDWILHDWVAPSLGHTVMDEFLKRQGSRITEREREMVEAWTQSFVGLYEVQELTAGVGLRLKDLIFGETFFVHDVSMSISLARERRGSEEAGRRAIL